MADPQSPLPPIDWEAIVGELTKFGHDVVERVGHRLEANAALAKDREYTADRMLDDVKAFWEAVADDVDRGIEICKNYVGHRGDVP